MKVYQARNSRRGGRHCAGRTVRKIYQKWNSSGSEAWPPLSLLPSSRRGTPTPPVVSFFDIYVPAITVCPISHGERLYWSPWCSQRLWDRSTLSAMADQCHLDNLKLMFLIRDRPMWSWLFWGTIGREESAAGPSAVALTRVVYENRRFTHTTHSHS